MPAEFDYTIPQERSCTDRDFFTAAKETRAPLRGCEWCSWELFATVSELPTCIFISFSCPINCFSVWFCLFVCFVIDPYDLVSTAHQKNFQCNIGESIRLFCSFFLVSAFFGFCLLLLKLFLADFTWLCICCFLGSWLDCSWFGD